MFSCFHYKSYVLLWLSMAGMRAFMVNGTLVYTRKAISVRIVLHLAFFGGHRRYILPPLSPFQPVIAGRKMIFLDRSQYCFFFPFISFFSSFFSVFESAASAHTTKAQTKRRQPQSIYVPQAQQNSLQPALHRAIKVHTAVRSCRPERGNAIKQTRKSKSSDAESHHVRIFYVSFFLFVVLCL